MNSNSFPIRPNELTEMLARWFHKKIKLANYKYMNPIIKSKAQKEIIYVLTILEAIEKINIYSNDFDNLMNSSGPVNSAF